MLISVLPALRRHARAATLVLRRELAAVCRRVWANYFSIGERFDLAFEIGSLLYDLELWSEAAAYFERSRDLHGDASHTLFNLAMCRFQLRRYPEALALLHAVLDREPAHGPSRAMRVRIAAELAAGG